MVIAATAKTRAAPKHEHWAGPVLQTIADTWLNSRVLCVVVTAWWALLAAAICGFVVSGAFNPPRGISASGQLIPPARPNPTYADVVPWAALLPLVLGIFAWFGLRWCRRFHQRAAANALKQIIIEERVTMAEWREAAALIDKSRSPLLQHGMRAWLEQWCSL